MTRPSSARSTPPATFSKPAVETPTTVPSSNGAPAAVPKATFGPIRRTEPAEKEFWEVWGEEKARAPRAPDDAPVAGPNAGPAAVVPTSVPDGMVRLYLNLGRKDGAGDSQIRDLLRERASFEGSAQIEIMNTHTYLNVPAADADPICSAITGKQMGDRDLVCERARPRR